MKSISILLFFFVGITFGAFAQQAELDTLYNRLYEIQYARNIDPNIGNWLNTLTNGRWSDIDYNTSKAYSPNDHNSRIKEIALAYVKNVSGNTYYNNAGVKAKLIQALNDNIGRKHYTVFNWLDYRKYNWFNDYIGSPEQYSQTLILLRNKLSISELSTYSGHLNDYIHIKYSDGTETFANTGQNLVWIAQITMSKGAIEKNRTYVKDAFESIASTLTITRRQGGEGIKLDNAFHQHGPQVYSGGYGLYFVNSIFNSMELGLNTSFMNVFTTTRRTIFSNLILNGHQWLSFKTNMDFGSVGRNIARPRRTGTIATDILSRLKVIDPTNAAAYQAWIDHRNGGAFYISGNKHFWQSDFMVHRAANYYLSTKIPSTRTRGTETMGGANLKGANLPFGAMNINTRGPEFNNIFPLWDWSRIPGTTAEMNVSSRSYVGEISKNEFGGGVSNQKSGLIAFNATYKEIAFNKAYFYMGDAVLCLGSGITASKTNPVATSINQTFTNGAITTSAGIVGTRNDYKWAHHDNVGYIFPTTHNITIQNVQQSGKWEDIGTFTSPTTAQNIYSLWIDHGKTPSNATYQYIVAPGKNLATFQSFATNHGFVVAQNTPNLQAVSNTLLKTYAVVFYTAGKVTFSDGFTITANKPALILVDQSSGKYGISISDPLYVKGTKIAVTFNRELSGITTALNISTINYTTPDPELFNITISKVYTAGITTNLDLKEELFENDHSIYPNPFIDKLNLISIGEYSIYNLSGLLIEDGSCNGNCEIGGDLLTGVYVLEFQTKELKRRAKIIKQ